MSTILNQANMILNEKETKIIPENIKSGVNIFDVTGNFTGSGGTQNIYKVSSIQERDALTPNDGDTCLVHSIKYTPINDDSIINKFWVPNSVVLDSAITTGSVYFHLEPVDGSPDTIQGEFYNKSGYIDLYGEPDFDPETGEETDNSTHIGFTSSDGLTYTINNAYGPKLEEGNCFNLGKNYMSYGEYGNTRWRPDLYNVVTTKGINVFNIYKYENNMWSVDNMYMSQQAGYAYGGTFYGVNGYEVSNITNFNTSTNKFLYPEDEVYGALSMKYLDFVPTVIPNSATSNSRQMYNYIPYNTKLIPMNAEGVALYDFGNCTNVYISGRRELKYIATLNLSSCSNFSVAGCSSLVGIGNLDTSHTNSINFERDFCLRRLPKLNLSNITNLTWSFYNCTNLTKIELTDAPKLNRMHETFANCVNLVDFPNITASYSTPNMLMNNAFGNCPNLSTQSIYNIVHLLNSYNQTNGYRVFRFATGLSNTQKEIAKGAPDMQGLIDKGWNIDKNY